MSQIQLIINGTEILLNDFVNDVIRDVVLALLKNLRDIELEEITTIEIS